MTGPVVALSEGAPEWLVAAVTEGGATIGVLPDADALVYRGKPAAVPTALPDRVRWVQLSSAGIESYLAAGVIDRRRVWTSAAGATAVNPQPGSTRTRHAGEQVGITR